MKAGDRVFRVVDDPGSLKDGEDWCVQGITVKVVGVKTIQLARPFTDLMRVKWTIGALGRVFFLTELEALADFEKRQQLDIESLVRRKARAELALKWANGMGDLFWAEGGRKP